MGLKIDWDLFKERLHDLYIGIYAGLASGSAVIITQTSWSSMKKIGVGLSILAIIGFLGTLSLSVRSD